MIFEKDTSCVIIKKYSEKGESMKLDARKIFIFVVLAICIVAINLVVYFQITQKPKEEQEQSNIAINEELLKENFDHIFDNQFDSQGYATNVNQIDDTKELIYTNYVNQTKLDNVYELNVAIPHLNIAHETAQKMNEEIDQLFYHKLIDILEQKKLYTIYNVSYKAYLNDNILSLIIHVTLKEGENPQRVILKTYNYNLSSNSSLGIRELLQYKNLSEASIQKKIKEEIKQASEKANQYKQLGYTTYLRNPDDTIYQIENTQFYFLGEGKALYILYPYGNSNYTSEVDLMIV